MRCRCTASCSRLSQRVNQDFLDKHGENAERFGSIGRVTAERHGAIRLGTPKELEQVGRIFAAFGMFACGFYDLRDAQPQPIPVISTAFRPIDRAELAVNPFRVFTSVLVPEDRRFFDQDLERRLNTFLSNRQIFSPELLELAERASSYGELSAADASRFLELATAAFALSAEPIDQAWYHELEKVSDVAADIGGVTSTHINHLTPRVLDIDALYQAMTDRGVAMIDRIQGPPRWDGPDVLLRQTSFRALAEPRVFRAPDGGLVPGSLRVRFGEVEVSWNGVDAGWPESVRFGHRSCRPRRRQLRPTARGVHCKGNMERPLSANGSRSVRSRPCLLHLPNRTQGSSTADGDLTELVASGALLRDPIVYEDFLPRSAAGIFASNLSSSSEADHEVAGVERTPGWLEDVLGARVEIPEEVYAVERQRSLDEAADALGIQVVARS